MICDPIFVSLNVSKQHHITLPKDSIKNHQMVICNTVLKPLTVLYSPKFKS